MIQNRNLGLAHEDLSCSFTESQIAMQPMRSLEQNRNPESQYRIITKSQNAPAPLWTAPCFSQNRNLTYII
jgi:hypothetical protein